MSDLILSNHMLIDIIMYFVVSMYVFGMLVWFAFIKPRKITRELRQALNDALHELEQIMQLTKNNPNSIVCISFEGEILFSNPAATNKFPDITEKGFDHSVLQNLEGLKNNVINRPDEEHVLNREINCEGGFYNQNISSIDYNGKEALIIYSYDTTAHKISEKKLQITKEAAEAANRAKSDFLANVSHELRTPMNGIIGLSQLLMESTQEEEQRELSTAVNSSSRNLLILLNDILDLSKIEAGELTLEHIPFDLRHTISQTVDLLRPIASRKSVILDSVISPIVHERIIGDPARLQQILNNLISNGIKFTEDGYVRLDVTSGRNKDNQTELHIYVEDTGIGIPKDKREIIFQKFTQANVSTARKYGGTGLGLSIIRELVNKMEGTISVDSVIDKGTTFFVKIPVEIAGTAKKSSSKKGRKNISINTDAKILVVDDHPINLLFMRKVLKKMGCKNAD
ncbi:MAG: hypothetical protein KAJ40_05930, partial [Alphaproteobacteria bacterium]|nr:hypothetical protein [Alphaproteobacteria bacterium]